MKWRASSSAIACALGTFALPISVAHAQSFEGSPAVPSTRSTQTQTQTVIVRWVSPALCGSPDQLRKRVVELIGTSRAELIEADVRTVEAGSRLRTEVTLLAPVHAAPRTFESVTCDHARESAAVVLAMTATVRADDGLDHSATANGLDEPEPSLLPFAIPSVGAREREVPPTASPAATPKWIVGAGGAMDVGTLPSAAFGGSIAIGYKLLPRLRVEALGSLWSGQSRGIEQTKLGANFAFFSVAARGCYLPLASRIELGACAGIDASRVTADGFGAARQNTSLATWIVAVNVGAVASVRLLDWIHIGARVDAIVPTDRRRYVILEGGTVHTASAVTMRAQFGPEVRF